MGWRETLEALYKNRDWNQATPDERSAAVAHVIQASSLAAAAVSATPVPLADLVLAMPLQAAMVVAVGHIKGRDISKEQSLTIARELSTVVGTHMLAQRAFVALSRLIFPGMAGLLMAPWTFAVTYGMGRVADLYFEDPNAPPEAFKQRFKQGLDDARKAFNKEALMDFIKRQGAEVKDYAQKEAAPAEPSADAGTRPAPKESSGAPAPATVVDAQWGDKDDGST